MKIGIDIDGVLTNDDDFILDYVTKYCYENNLDCLNNPYDYEYKKFSLNEELLKQYREKYFWEYVINEPPRKFASEIIKKLKEEGNQIYIITSRYLSTRQNQIGNIMQNEIKKWLEKHDIVYDDIYFSSDKTVQIRELNLDVMIEDSPERIPTYINYVHVFCYDCRYNRKLNCSNTTRVFSWYDIYTKLKKSKWQDE